MKIVTIDIETRPNQAFTWGLWDQNVGLNQLIESSSILCWAAKWYGKKEIHFGSVRNKGMLKGIHNILSEADAVVTWNGDNFDLPTLNREFLVAGMPPPAPYKRIDLLKTARDKFKFTSNKLEYVGPHLGLGKKVKHPGFELWLGCMAGNADSWTLMEKYNKQDVVLTEKVYDKVRPWITNHPNIGAFDSRLDACPNCGGQYLQRRGEAVTRDTRYQRYQCRDCGAWSRGKAAVMKSTTTLVGVS